MFNTSEHLKSLYRHIDLVRQGCQTLGERLIDAGREEFGRLLIMRGYRHDASKFSGIEWDYLHRGNDIPRDKIDLAVKQHQSTNDHHPEFWGGINQMPEIALVEAIADWRARSFEFGTSLKDWVKDKVPVKFNPSKEVLEKINYYVDIFTEDHFVK